MKSRPVNLFVKFTAVAVAFAGITLTVGYGANRVLPPRRTAPPEREKTTVWVANRNLGMGTLMKEPVKLFEEKQLPGTSEKAIRNLEELTDRRLNKPLPAGQVVTSDDVVDKNPMPTIPLVVQSIVGADFVLPHSRVDVDLEIVSPDDEPLVETIVQDVLVLADGSSYGPANQPGMQSYCVGVQVTPEQAERLILAQRRGRLTLIGRPPSDDKPVRTEADNVQRKW